jgi:hypothetical protein
MVAGQDDSHTGGKDPDEEIRNTRRPGLIKKKSGHGGQDR